MVVRRVVPNVRSEALQESREFYGLLGFEEVMNLGWIVTVASPSVPTAQVSVMTSDKTAPVVADMSVEVDDVDAAYAAVRDSGAEIVHPLQDEEWGCADSSSATPTAEWSTCWVIAERGPKRRLDFVERLPDGFPKSSALAGSLQRA